MPINGTVPTDGEYRIINGSIVEQWSEWAGMWDTAFHASCPQDAERYVREHTEQVIRTYYIAGLRRQVGAIGSFEPFFASEAGTSVEDARNKLVESFNAGGFDHVHIRCIAPVYSVRVSPEEEDCEPTTVEDRYLAIEANIALLARTGVPRDILNTTVSCRKVILEATRLRWDTYHDDNDLRFPSLHLVDEWSTEFRQVWTDRERLIVTYCETDLSGELFFSPEAFAEAWARAAEFYANH